MESSLFNPLLYSVHPLNHAHVLFEHRGSLPKSYDQQRLRALARTLFSEYGYFDTIRSKYSNPLGDLVWGWRCGVGVQSFKHTCSYFVHIVSLFSPSFLTNFNSCSFSFILSHYLSYEPSRGYHNPPVVLSALFHGLATYFFILSE